MADTEAREALTARVESDLAELADIVAMIESDPEIGPLLASPELSAPGGFIDPDDPQQSELYRRTRNGLLLFRRALIEAKRGLEAGFPDRIARALRVARTQFDDARLLWQRYQLLYPPREARKRGGQKRGEAAARAAAERQAPFRIIYERRREAGATHEKAAAAVDQEMSRQGIVISSSTRARWLKSFREAFWSQAS